LNELEVRLKRKLGLSDEAQKNWNLCVLNDEQIIPIQDKPTTTTTTTTTNAITTNTTINKSENTNENKSQNSTANNNNNNNTATITPQNGNQQTAVSIILTNELFSFLSKNDGRSCLVMVHEDNWNNVWSARKLSSRNKGSGGSNGSLLING